MEIHDPRFTIEDLMEQIREGARLRAESNGGADGNAPPSAFTMHDARAVNSSGPNADSTIYTLPEITSIALQPEFEPHSDDQYDVGELLQYHDRNFIQNAYRAVLKRGPDATGFTSFIESLRSGRLNKIDVLARLRYSQEGRAKGVRVRGLFVPAAVRQLYRLPLVGYLLRWGVALARLPASVRNQQQFEAHVHAQQQLIVDYANHLGATLNQQQREVARSFAQLANSARLESGRQQQQLDQLRQEQQSLRDAQSAIVNSQQALRRELLEHDAATLAELLARLNAVQQQFDILIEKAVAHWQRELQRLETLHSQQNAETRAQAEQLTQTLRLESQALAQTLRAEVERIFHKQQEIRAELALQRQRVRRLLETAAQPLAAPSVSPERGVLADERQHLNDAFYLALEDRFRGRPAEIRERLKVYLPFVEQARVTEAQPLLDIGCGRGEWLQLLQETGVPARGIDANRAVVAAGQAQGLSMIEADVIDYLAELPDESLSALTGFHIIEHLPLPTLLRLLDETMRVLRRGGLVIFETPNPENVLVGSCNFYFDPTHQHPLPPTMMKFMLESRGLNRVEILRLNPSDAEPVTGDTDLIRRFNQFFYGPMDYALVGWISESRSQEPEARSQKKSKSE